MRGAVAVGRLEELQVCKLLQCVHRGDKPQIEKLVRLGVVDLINMVGPREGEGGLHLASVANDLDMAGFLLAQGAHPDVQDKRGRTPVMRAAELGHDGMVALLVENRADMSVVDSEGKGVLFYCISPTKRHVRCLQVALNGTADINNVSASGKPVFLLACELAQDCESMCLSILEKGADPNAASQATGRTPLMEAAKAGAPGLVRAILRKGGNANALDKKRTHAAHLAAERGFFEVIQVLSAYSADLGVVTTEGNTPLHYAARGGFTDCCRFLAQRGCNPKLKNQEGMAPRQIAKDGGHKAVVKELMKAERLHGKYSRVGAVNPNQPWALTLHDWSLEHEAGLRAAFAGAKGGAPREAVSSETFASVLWDQGAPVDGESLQKVVLAHDKRREGRVNVDEFFKGVRFLQKAFVMASYGPKKKKAAGRGGKAGKKAKFVLPLPICTMPPELIYRRPDGGPPRYMIESYQHHSDPGRWDRDHPPEHPIEDDSAWYVDEPERIYVNVNHCAKTGELQSLRLAFSQQVPVDVKDRFYKTPLMAACASANYETARFLIGLGANVNACDQFNWTPLHHACHAGQVEIIDLLVRAGAPLDPPALNGATPLMRAIESCRPTCVDYLIKAGAKVQAQNKNGQNCLDVARVYADFRILEMVKAKFDTLPKPKENKRGKSFKPPPKVRPATAATDKVSQGPPALSAGPSDAAVKKEPLKESIVFQNTQITSGAVNKTDISFVPRTVWGQQVTTSELIRRKEERRARLTSEVDFEDFMMPFLKNVTKRSKELQGPEDQ